MEITEELHGMVERLASRIDQAMEMLERVVSQQSLMASSAEEPIGRIVATVESRREAELEEKLAAAAQTIAQLRASAPVSVTNANRRTVAAGLMAKQEGAGEGATLAGVLDAALVSLSLEQRIAVKAQLLRAGLV